MKKSFILMISLLMVTNLFGCGNNETSTSDNVSQPQIILSETTLNESTQEISTNEEISQSIIVENSSSETTLNEITAEEISIEETSENQEVNNKTLIVYYSLPKGAEIDSDGSASRVYINGETIGSVNM